MTGSFDPRSRAPSAQAQRQALSGLATGVLPDRSASMELLTSWMTPGALMCDQGVIATCPSGMHVANRCAHDYWIQHSYEVAAAMEAVAHAIGQDTELWWATGLLHDIDYPTYPHHEVAIDDQDAHPLGAADALSKAAYPTELITAVIEHSPHTGMSPSSPLSAALILVDEHSTMRGAGITPSWASTAAERRLSALLDQYTGPKGITGYVRSDMADRAAKAARVLLA